MSRLTLLIATFGACSIATAAHPGHYSIAEVEWNAKSDRFEVALRVPLAELEDAVANRLKRRVSLEHSKEREKHIIEYLRDHVSITRAADRASRIHWVGMELELHDAWLYFEIESVAGELGEPATTTAAVPADQITIRNTMLQELHPKQLNLMNLRTASGVQSVTLTADNPKQAVIQVKRGLR